MKVPVDTRMSQWNAIVDLITLSQFNRCMGDNCRSWQAKAEQVKRVSRSKRVHALADGLIATCQQLNETVTWFDGQRLPRKSKLVRELISAHVEAVQEYDHYAAEEIEEYLHELAVQGGAR